MHNIHWASVVLGILFIMFGWPFISRLMAKGKPNTQRTA